MDERFVEVLAVGGRSNSLGRVEEVIAAVLDDRDRLEELIDCLSADDAWTRMRAADALEKVCRERPDWMAAHVDRLQRDLSDSTQPSIQWHLAQIYRQVDLTDAQRRRAVRWLTELLATTDVDWIAAANAMQTLVAFAEEGHVDPALCTPLLRIQLGHRSASVVKRATKLLAGLADTPG